MFNCLLAGKQAKNNYIVSSPGAACMAKHITPEEIQRMKAFANTPVYKREPEQLMPDQDESQHT